MKIKLSIVIFLLIQNVLFAQTFTPLSYGVNNDIRSMFYDSSTNILFAGSNFMTDASGTSVSKIAQWDGIQWDSLSSGVNDGGIINSIIKYQNNIVVGGSFNIIGNVNTIGAALWNGSSFQPLADFKYDGYGCVSGFYVDGSDLYVMGCFDTLNNQPAYGLVKYDGSSWIIYPPLDPEVGTILQALFFNGELYVSGSFVGPNFPSSSIIAMAKWDGTQWQKVGAGFNNINDGVVSMVIYHGELYAGGYFFTSSGGPGNCIARWNGTAWAQCGSGVFSQIYQLAVYNDELYACGQISQAGGIPVTSIAKWDGNQWSSVAGGTVNGTFGCFAVGNGDLYIGGGFWDISGDTLMRNIAKYNLPLGVTEISEKINFTTSPNPFINTLTVTIPHVKGTVYITDITGKEVYRTAFTNSSEQQLQLAWLQPGMYFLTVSTNGEASTKKIIKL